MPLCLRYKVEKEKKILEKTVEGKTKSSNKYCQCLANHALIISQSNYTAIIAPIISKLAHLKERIHMS